jgi:hypothetical protein
MLEAVCAWKSRGAPQLLHLEHFQHRLAAVPGHEPEAVKSACARGGQGTSRPPPTMRFGGRIGGRRL